MDSLHISLFGRLCIRYGGQDKEIESQKAQELLAFLLMYRSRCHYREKLAALLWPNSSTSQSKGYLRQTLWQLQSSLDDDLKLLQVESDWIGVEDTCPLWLDVAIFEQAFEQTQGQRGNTLKISQVQALQEAVALYEADLLESWYQDWCLFERERLQNIYLGMLGKLVGYHEARGQYETCIVYCSDILRCDRAHERTYRRLMRIYDLAGDRSGALRIYERCRAALNEELGVAPSQRTISLLEEIRAGRSPEPLEQAPPPPNGQTPDNDLQRLLRLRLTLSKAQQQLEQEIASIRQVLQHRR